MIREEDILLQLEKDLMGWGQEAKTINIGIVERNTDGVIQATGLSKAVMGERVEFDNGVSGVVLNLDEDFVSIILLGEASNIKEGDVVKRTGEMLSINASDGLLGRVVNPLGDPL